MDPELWKSGKLGVPGLLPMTADEWTGNQEGARASRGYPRIRRLVTTMLSGEEMRRQAVKEVVDNNLYVKLAPKPGGPNDLSMGPSDRHSFCDTCGNEWFKCTGHEGVVRLPLPMYNPGHFKIMYKVLQATCWVCGHPLGLPARGPDPANRCLFVTPESTGRSRLEALAAAGKGKKKCASCGCPQPVYGHPKSLSVGLSIWREFPDDRLAVLTAYAPHLLYRATRPVFTPSDALDVLASIRDDDVEAYGLPPEVVHPRDFILTNVVVLPPNARPAVVAMEGSKRRGQDDVTSQIQDVLREKRMLVRAILKRELPKLFERNKAQAVGATQRATGGKKRALAVLVAALAGPVPGPPNAHGSAHAPQAGPAPGGAPKKPAPPSRSNLAAALAPYLATAEYEVRTGAPGELLVPEVRALAAAMPSADFTLSSDQAADVWMAFPVLCEKLQNAVTTYLDNSGKFAPQSRQRAGAVREGLAARISGKAGRIRKNNVAKRTKFCARTVVAPAPTCLDVDMVGVPEATATTLTVPETVTGRNQRRLAAAVAAGPGVLGGATTLEKASGPYVLLQYLGEADRARLDVEPGDIVHRHLHDGDVVLMNRQPSLHVPSIMAHKCKVIKGLAFRLPLAVTTPYNADFDGDEMNLHVVQDAMAIADTKQLMSVTQHVINAQNNAPTFGLVQDSRIGGFLLTSRHTYLTKEQVDACVVAMKRPPVKAGVPPGGVPPPALVNGGTPYWTGKQVVSLLLPDGLCMERWVRGADPGSCGPDDPSERYVLVLDGTLVAGMLCKATLGTAPDGLVHKIAVQFGYEAATAFISDFQRVVGAWLPTWGLSTGWEDCMIPPDTARVLADLTATVDATVTALTAEAAALAKDTTPAEALRIEAGIQEYLHTALDLTQRVALQHTEGALLAVLQARAPPGVAPAAGEPGGPPPPIAAFRAMVDAGSKGNVVNLAHVTCAIGQQTVNGRRIGPGGASNRTLPMFPAGAYQASARGFVSSSFVAGLKPAEYWFHMQAGREGLVRTAVGTKVTGTLQRHMAKSMETNVVTWDGTVRNGKDYVIQLVAGGDGFEPTRVQRVSMKTILHAGREEVANACGGPDSWWTSVTLALQGHFRAGLLPLAAVMCGRSGVATTFPLPVNVRDEVVRFADRSSPLWLELAGRARGCGAPGGSQAPTAPLQPAPLPDDAEYGDAVAALFGYLDTAVASPEAIVHLKLAVMWECRPAVLRHAGLSPTRFLDTVGNEVFLRTLGAAAPPGSSLGIVAAQSIGEPATQLTLNAFHHAGLVLRQMTVGMPRMTEVLGAQPAISTPAMLLPFLDQGLDMGTAEALARSLVHLTLANVLKSSYVEHDPAGVGTPALPFTTKTKDADLLDTAARVHGSELCAALELAHTIPAVGVVPAGPPTGGGTNLPEGTPALAPWVIRMVLNRSVMERHGRTPEMVARAVAVALATTPCLVVYSQPGAAKWVVRVRPLGPPQNGERTCRQIHAKLRTGIVLGGIPGIRDAKVVRVPRCVVDPATGRIVTQDLLAVDAEGAALAAVASVPWIDWNSSITNHVQEVEAVLGISAAETTLFTELHHVVTNDGTVVDARHLKQVTASMTYRGSVVGMSRFGMNKTDAPPFLRASFEEQVDVLYKAAATGEEDELNGMCQAVLAGQKAPVGSGTVTVVPDLDADDTAGYADLHAAVAAAALHQRDHRVAAEAMVAVPTRLRKASVAKAALQGPTIAYAAKMTGRMIVLGADGMPAPATTW
jgi:DNA-directed RNA polymerase beta' subunit